MYNQTQNTQVYRDGPGWFSSVVVALVLYLLTLVGELMLGASTRWLLVYICTVISGTIIPLGISAVLLASVAAFAPICWSVMGLVLPGRGRLRARRLGARRASGEEAMMVGEGMALLYSAAPHLVGPAAYYILDDPLPMAETCGRTLILSRGLVESESLVAVMAHELGHAETLDGRLTEALNRLVLWKDPLAPRPSRVGEDVPVVYDPDLIGGFFWGCLRWLLRLAGGSSVTGLLTPFWAMHWRAREFVADAFAASLGQAEDLARHLVEQELPFDAPQPRRLLNAAEHPPVALRVERLLPSTPEGPA